MLRAYLKKLDYFEVHRCEKKIENYEDVLYFA